MGNRPLLKQWSFFMLNCGKNYLKVWQKCGKLKSRYTKVCFAKDISIKRGIKYMKKIILLLFMVIAVTIWTGSAYAADYGTGEVSGTTSGLNARSGAGTEYKVVGSLSEGKKVTLREEISKDGKVWYRIVYDNQKAYVSGKYIKKLEPYSYTIYTPVKYGKVTSALNVRSGAGTSYSRRGTLKKGEKITLKGYKYVNGRQWYRITYKGKAGWVSSKYVKRVSASYSMSSVSEGDEVVSYAKRYLGTPYVWGGTRFSSGVDCSGFTMAVYSHFGKNLPHYSYDQEKCGRRVSYSDAEPGDLICYGSHVAIYTGDGKMIHASSSKGKVVIGNAKYRSIKCVRRIV